MTPRRTLLGALLLLLVPLMSCGDDERVTEIVVVIDSDIEGLSRIELRVDFFSDERVATTDVDPVSPKLPQTLGIVHEGGDLGPITIEATGFVNDDQVAVRRVSKVSFIAGETMMLRMDLTKACLGVYRACEMQDGERTCVDGICEDAEEAGSLERWKGEPGRTLASVPGGSPTIPPGDTTPPPSTPGGSAGNGSTSDAGTPMPDAGMQEPPGDAGAPDAAVDGGGQVPLELGCVAAEELALNPDCHATDVDCVGQDCVFSCSDGWGDCDQAATNGCETDLLNDPLNCGGCGSACPFDALNVASCSCVLGEPQLVCRLFGLPIVDDCDGLPENGCETLLTTNDNCGQCGRECTCNVVVCADGDGQAN